MRQSPADEPVHVVEQVERVGQADDPHQREDGVERERVNPRQPVAEEDEQ